MATQLINPDSAYDVFVTLLKTSSENNEDIQSIHIGSLDLDKVLDRDSSGYPGTFFGVAAKDDSSRLPNPVLSHTDVFNLDQGSQQIQLS